MTKALPKVCVLTRRIVRRFKKKADACCAAQHALWSLSQTHKDARFEHNFLSVRDDLKLHYLSPKRSLLGKKKSKLIIFLHGFPDSSHIFADFLSPPLADHANLVSLDLPGFGGSDGLPNYGADEVLNAIADAVAVLKQRYLCPREGNKPGLCILVGHDWGSAIASRLAMETTGLIDRLVLINGVVPRLFTHNIRRGIMDCSACLQEWWAQKWSPEKLYEAKEAVRPVVAQLVKSNYIFMFRLPFFRAARFDFVMDHLISICHRAVRRDKVDDWEGRSWASSIGPGVEQCSVSEQADGYGTSVAERAMRYSSGDWDTRLRFYREDLFSGTWTLCGDLVSQGVTQAHSTTNTSHGTFQCPASILFGVRDFALDYRICVTGVEDFFRPANGKKGAESHIVLAKDCGHWSPLEQTGSQVLRSMLLEVMGVATASTTDMADQTTIRRSDFG